MLQQGKNTDMGCSFSANTSNALFGSSSNGTIITCMTAVLAMLFFVLSLVLGNLISSQKQKSRQVDNINQVQLADQVTKLAPAKLGNNIPQ